MLKVQLKPEEVGRVGVCVPAGQCFQFPVCFQNEGSSFKVHTDV